MGGEKMNDREMIELAAKAAGYRVRLAKIRHNKEVFEIYIENSGPAEHLCWNEWSPRTDDGDALRLAVRLQLGIEMQFDSVVVFIRNRSCVVETHYRQDVEAATRSAIFRAAAEIGKAMEQNK